MNTNIITKTLYLPVEVDKNLITGISTAHVQNHSRDKWRHSKVHPCIFCFILRETRWMAESSILALYTLENNYLYLIDLIAVLVDLSCWFTSCATCVTGRWWDKIFNIWFYSSLIFVCDTGTRYLRSHPKDRPNLSLDFKLYRWLFYCHIIILELIGRVLIQNLQYDDQLSYWGCL